MTAANIALGFGSMLLAADGRFDAAVHLLVLAVMLDMLDGKLARLLHATSQFGKQMDSFCDVVSFGAAPAFLVYQAVLRPMGVVGVSISLIYLLAGVYRLARFNLISDPHAKARRTMGVPIPVGAGYLMATTLMRDRIDPAWGAALVLIVAVALVSHWRLPELSGINVVTGMLLVGVFNYLALVFWPNWYTVGWWNVWNVLIVIAAKQEDRKQTMAEPSRT